MTIQVETLSREDLASRLTLNVDVATVGSLLISDAYITIMDVSCLKLVSIHMHLEHLSTSNTLESSKQGLSKIDINFSMIGKVSSVFV